GAVAFGAAAPASLRSLKVPSLATRLLAFDSDAAMEAFIRTSSYSVQPDQPRIWAAVILNAWLPAADYSIRMNSSEVVPTDLPATDNLLVVPDMSHIDNY